MSKRLGTYFQLIHENAMSFCFVNYELPSNDECDEIAQFCEEFRQVSNAKSEKEYYFPSKNSVKILCKKENKSLAYALYLRDIIKYVPVFLHISNEGVYDNYIPKPIVDSEFVSVYLYAFTYSLNCHNKRKFTQANFIELFRILTVYPSKFCQTTQQETFRKSLSQMIIKNLFCLDTEFYLSRDMEYQYCRSIVSEFTELFSDAALHSRSTYFINYMIPLYEHRLCKDARLSYMSPNLVETDAITMTSAFSSATAKINNWPQVQIKNTSNFINNVDLTIGMPLSIKHLAKFYAHIHPPGLADFSLDFGLSDLENREYNTALNMHLVDEKHTNTAGLLSIQSLSFNKNEFANCVTEFTATYFTQPSKIELLGEIDKKRLFDYVINLLGESKLYIAEISKIMSKFGFGYSIALLYQTVSVDEKPPVSIHLRPEFERNNLLSKGFLLSDSVKLAVSDVLMDTLVVSKCLESILIGPASGYNKASIEPLFNNNIPNQNKILYMAETIVNRIVNGKSMILQTGNPVKVKDYHSDHAFYVVFKYLAYDQTVTIFIVNGGFTDAAFVVDDEYEQQDQGAGGYWKCRETEPIALNTTDHNDKIEFLKQYIYKVMTLMYFHCDPKSNQIGWKFNDLIDNVYLISAPFLGFGFQPTKFFPSISKKPRTFISQVFANCTIYNLIGAIELLFDMDRNDCQVFHQHIIYSFSYLLYQNDSILLQYAHNNSSATATNTAPTTTNTAPPTTTTTNTAPPTAGGTIDIEGGNMMDYF